MNSVFPLLYIVILNLVPGDAKLITLEGEGTQVLHFTKQVEGGWSLQEGADKNQAILTVDGAKLTEQRAGKETTQDLSRKLGVDPAPDWKKLEGFMFGNTRVQIEHEADGLNFHFRQKRRGAAVDDVEGGGPAVAAALDEAGGRMLERHAELVEQLRKQAENADPEQAAALEQAAKKAEAQILKMIANLEMEADRVTEAQRKATRPFGKIQNTFKVRWKPEP